MIFETVFNGLQPKMNCSLFKEKLASLQEKADQF